jgi:6-phosphogluconate dehydrogenase
MDAAREFGVIGLGRMGGNLALQALDQGMRVVGFDTAPPREELVGAGLEDYGTVAELCAQLAPPRKIMIYVPVGSGIDALLEALVPALARGDVVMDGGNSYWGDSRRRAERLRPFGIALLDVGTSGGMEGARHGACFMVGGERAAVAEFEPILKALAVPGGYVHAGGSGAGHFTKLVHNGIEFGMMQAIGEGIDLLLNYPEPIATGEVLAAWQHGTVIRSWLIELMSAQFDAHGGLHAVPAHVEDTGEVNWLVEYALHMEVPIPVIAQSIMELFTSRDRNRWASRAIALMRNAFGGHPLGPNATIATRRHLGRMGEH